MAKYPRQVKAVETYIEELGKAEDAQESNIDKISGLTGTMLGEIFAWREDIWAEELRYFGFYLGKFVYLMDAYEDFETDKRKNAYNVFRVQRKEDMQKAYFGCHTDITIPYEEIGEITAVCADGRRIPVIQDGRFVLAGTEELNKPFNEK